MTSLRTYLQELRGMAEKASPPTDYVARRVGMHPEMRGMHILGSHNRTPFMYAYNADFISSSRTAVPRLVEMVEACVVALEEIGKRPDLPNPERDADWKNCMKWSSAQAQQCLSELAALAGKEKP